MEELKKTLITKAVNRYRECARSIWNNYFLEQFQSTKHWDLVESFNRIQQELFDSIVLTPTLFDDEKIDFILGYPCHQIKLVPAWDDKWDIPVEINREKGMRAGYWDHPVKKISSQAELSFINFFDWDATGFLEMSKIMAEISNFPENPNLNQHSLFVDTIYVDFFFIHNNSC